MNLKHTHKITIAMNFNEITSLTLGSAESFTLNTEAPILTGINSSEINSIDITKQHEKSNTQNTNFSDSKNIKTQKNVKIEKTQKEYEGLISEVKNNECYMIFERAIFQKALIVNNYTLNMVVSDERHIVSAKTGTVEFTTELLFNYVEGSSLFRDRFSEVADLSKQQFFEFSNPIKKLSVVLIPMSNGGLKVNIRRIFGKYSDQPAIYSINSVRFPYPLPLERGCERINHHVFYSEYDPSTFVAMLQGGALSSLKKMDAAGDKISNLCDRVSASMDSAQAKVTEVLTNLNDDIKDGIAITLTITAVGGALCYYYKRDTTSFRISVFSTVCLTLLKGPDLMSKIMDYISIPADCVTVQGSSSESSFIHSFMYETFGINYNDFKKIFDIVSHGDKFIGGLTKILTTLLELVNKICDYITKTRPIPDSWILGSMTKAEILKVGAEMDQFCEDLHSGVLPSNHDTYRSACELKHKLEVLTLDKPTSTTAAILNYRVRKIDGVIDTLITSVPGIAEIRPEPVGILFVGAPGTTKTHWSNCFASCLVDNQDEIYHRSIDSEFWDDYRNQEITIVDDFGKARDVAGTPNKEYSELMDMINTCPYQCHVANVENKGKIYFNSSYVMCTSNINKFHIESLIDKGAVTRRFTDLVFVVVPKDEYCKNPSADYFHRLLDWDKVGLDADGVADLRADMFTFVKRDAVTGEYGNVHYTAKDLVAMFKQRRKRNVAMHEKNLENIKIIKSEIEDDCAMDDISSIYTDSDVSLTEVEKPTGKSVEGGWRIVFNTLKEKFPIVLPTYSSFIAFWARRLPRSEFRRIYAEKFSSIDIMRFSRENYQMLKSTFSKEQMSSFVSALKEDFKEDRYYMKSVSFIAVGSAITTTIILGINWWNSSIALPQSSSQTPIKTPREWKELKVPSTPANIQAGDLQDLNGRTLILSTIKRSQYVLLYSNSVKMGYVLAIGGRWLLMSKHFLEILREEVTQDQGEETSIMYLRRCADIHPSVANFALTKGELLNCEIEFDGGSRDLITLQLPERFQPRKDIVDLFKSKDTFKNRYDLARRVIVTPDSTKIGHVLFNETVGALQFIANQNILIDAEKRVIEPRQVYAGKFINDKGYCGSLYTECNAALQKGKILGIHYGGHTDNSFLTPVFYEDLVSTRARFEIDPIMEQAVEIQAADPFNNKFECLGKAEPFAAVTRSTLAKSKLFGRLKDTEKYPARLHPFVTSDGEQVDPVIKSLDRYNSVQDVVIPIKVYNALRDSEIDFYYSVQTRTTARRVYTYEEAAQGLLDDIEFRGISRKTSPGYPYILNRRGKGKHDWFGKEGDFDFTTEKSILLKNEINEDIKNILDKNIVPTMYFIDTLKDECVSLKKFEIGKTRTFSGGSIKMLIMFRMYFGAFMNSFLKNRIDNGSAIGVNQYSEEWNSIAVFLRGKNSKVNAGDFSGFDTKQCSQLLSMVREIIEPFYEGATHDEIKIRRFLWKRISNSIHIAKGNVYLWDCALPSGNPLTAMINSMVNRISHKYCFYRSLGNQLRSFWIFNENVYLVTVGDDCVFTVAEEFSQVFNENVIEKYFAELGMIYTPEDKEAFRDGRIRSLEEITFLKRRFRFEPLLGRYIAPMLLEPLLDQLNWTRKEGGDTITMDKCRTVVRELALHGKETYNKYVPIINHLMREVFGETLYCTSFLMSLEEVSNLEVCYDLEFNQTMTNTTNTMLCDADYTSGTDGCNRYNVNEFKEFDERIPVTIQADRGDVVDTGAADVVMQDNAVTDTVDRVEMNVSRKWDSSFNDDKNPDIKQFLSKPVRILTDEFAGTNGPSSFADFYWSEPLTKTVMPDKMKGIYTIKATLVLTLQCNANPMQQGRYILAYLPLGGASRTSDQTRWARMHRFSIVQILQLDHVEFDLSCDTSVVLRVPWVSGYNSYLYESTRTYATEPGKFFIYPYEPLANNGGSNTASFVLWGHYEDIELGIVGSLQAGENSLAKMGKAAGDFLAREQLAGTKTISKTLTSAADTIGVFGKIPLLTSLAAPLEWATRALAMGASSLGFSKPNLITAPTRVVNNNFPYMGVADGVDGAEPMGMTIGNHVSMDPSLYGTTVDEMSVAFIASRPSYLGSVDWSTAPLVGTELATFSVTPSVSQFLQTDSTVSVTSFGPLAFLSRMFNYWRGSLVFTIKIVKTCYHSGRLVAVYFPYDDALTLAKGTASLDLTDYAYRNIIDIREKNEVKITVPYVNPAPWQETKNGGGATGVFKIYVLDPLKAPSVVSSTVTLKIEQQGGPDLAFACPRNIEFDPVVPATVQAGDTSSPEECRFDVTTIGNGKVPPLNMNGEEASIGESVTSLRSFYKRGGYINPNLLSTYVTQSILLSPYFNYWYRITASTLTGGAEDVSRDWYSVFSSIYALSRGGLRIRAIPVDSRTGNNIVISLDSVNTSAGAISEISQSQAENISDYTYYQGNVANLAYQSNTPTSGIVIPQYTRTLSRICASHFILSGATVSYSNAEPSCSQVTCYCPNATAVGECKFWFHRAGADDGSFGNFVSIPPVALNYGG